MAKPFVKSSEGRPRGGLSLAEGLAKGGSRVVRGACQGWLEGRPRVLPRASEWGLSPSNATLGIGSSPPSARLKPPLGKAQAPPRRGQGYPRQGSTPPSARLKPPLGKAQAPPRQGLFFGILSSPSSLSTALLRSTLARRSNSYALGSESLMPRSDVTIVERDARRGSKKMWGGASRCEGLGARAEGGLEPCRGGA